MTTMPTSITTAAALTSPPMTISPPAEGGSSSLSPSLPLSGSGGGAHNGREARNLAEKHRRDKLNASIQELATMVPHVVESTRRLDKTAVLRFAAHGLRLQHVFGKTALKQQSLHCADGGGGGGVAGGGSSAANAGAFLVTQPELTDTLMQLLDSFFITLTCHGQIVVISASVEQLLGHCQSDLYGQNILNITHPEDHTLLLQQLIPRDLESLFRNDYQQPQQHSSPHHRQHQYQQEHQQQQQQQHHQLLQDDQENEEVEEEPPDEYTEFYQRSLIDERLRADRRCFTVRLARAGTRSTEATRNYEIVKIDGCFRRSDFSAAAGNFPIVSQLIRRSRNTGQSASLACPSLLQHDAIAQAALHGISGNDIVLVAMARIIRAPKILNRLLEANQLEYRTRHLIDGRIIDCDQRIGLVAGYMKDEVRNLSPFSFMHQDDVRWVIVALRQMYDCNSDYGESCYRLLSRNGHFIYLQTKGYLEIDKITNKVHSFVCVNTLLDEEQGRRKVQEMKNKFSVIIKTKIPTNSLQDVPASQNPQQLERIVLYLIENLQKRNENMALSGGEGSNNGGCVSGRTSTVTSQFADGRYYATTTATSPPLALVPPEPASVKNSISKSVNIVNVTAARNLQSNLRSPVSVQGSDASLSPASSVDQCSADEATEFITATYNNCSSSSSSSNSSSSSDRHNGKTQRPSVLKMSNTLPEANKHTGNAKTASLVTPTTDKMPATKQKLQRQISVLKRLHASSPVQQISDGCSSRAKRSIESTSASSSPVLDTATTSRTDSPSSACLEIHTVLSSSLRNLDQSLHSIEQNARTLSQQRAHIISPVPQYIDQKLDAIFVEHQKQEQILGNIKTEYDFHVHQQQREDHASGRPAVSSNMCNLNETAVTEQQGKLL